MTRHALTAVFGLALLATAVGAEKHPPAASGTITIRVSPEAYPRAKDLADLMPLLTEDFEDMGKGMVDLKLRARINAIMKRLPREQ